MQVAVILSGCGNRDGSELQETLSLLLALDRRDIRYQCFAPKTDFAVVDYLSGKGETGEKRSLFAEAARIARGNILDLTEYRADNYDALCLPGGMGAARNLSTYAFDGKNMQVMPEVERAILDTHKQKKPVCAMCIAPIVLAKVLGPYGVKLTMGQHCEASEVAESLGAHQVDCQPTEVAVDKENRVITTPAYMVASRISEIFDGADNMVKELCEMLR